jgi:serine/threonine protein kinase
MRPSDPYQPSPLAAAEGVLDRIVGSYRLKGVLGRGGMGEVYLAEHVRMGQRVALKLILPEHRERPEAVQRFHNEARALAKVSHPGVVAVFDVSELPDGSCYLVLEYLAGSSLRERLRTPGEPLSLAHSLHILQQAAVALAAVHHAGIIHRDLSPANLMLVPDGGSPPFRVKLLDFGLAKQSQAEAHTDTSQNTTRDGAVIGTDQDISDFPSESVVRSAVTGAPKVGQACHKMVEVWCEVRSWRSAQYNSLRHRN